MPGKSNSALKSPDPDGDKKRKFVPLRIRWDKADLNQYYTLTGMRLQPILNELGPLYSSVVNDFAKSHANNYCWHDDDKNVTDFSINISNDIITVSSSARNLGFIFDSDMSFSEQISSVSKSCHFHIRDIRRIRHLLPLSAATALANSLVSSKLDYCNSLYSGISQSNFNKLQRIQNSLARVITNTSKYQHITPTLKKLHWLPITQRIDYKLCLLTYKTLTNQQPTYLYNSLSFPSHSVSTRSSDSLVLSIPYVRSSLGKRAYSVMVHDFGIHYFLIPEIRILYQLSVPSSKHTSSKLHSLPRLFPISLDCLPGF